MHFLFATRFSIFDASLPGQWKLARSVVSADEYRDVLFDDLRLEVKFACFERLTVPGMLAQRLGPGQRMRWLVFASMDLPQPFRLRLLAAVGRVRGGLVVWVASMAEFEEHLDAEVWRLEQAGIPFATVRLDDDDGLGATYCSVLGRYADHGGQVVSFVAGRHVRVTLQDRDTMAAFAVGRPIMEPYNAFGMAMVGGNIYRAGNHKRVAERFVVHLDHTPDMWLSACSPLSDTWRKARGMPAGVMPTFVALGGTRDKWSMDADRSEAEQQREEVASERQEEVDSEQQVAEGGELPEVDDGERSEAQGDELREAGDGERSEAQGDELREAESGELPEAESGELPEAESGELPEVGDGERDEGGELPEAESGELSKVGDGERGECGGFDVGGEVKVGSGEQVPEVQVAKVAEPEQERADELTSSQERAPTQPKPAEPELAEPAGPAGPAEPEAAGPAEPEAAQPADAEADLSLLAVESVELAGTQPPRAGPAVTSTSIATLRDQAARLELRASERLQNLSPAVLALIGDVPRSAPARPAAPPPEPAAPTKPIVLLSNKKKEPPRPRGPPRPKPRATTMTPDTLRLVLAQQAMLAKRASRFMARR